MKGLVYVPPLPANLEELKEIITTALQTATKTCCSMLGRSWSTELMCAVPQVGHILNIFDVGYIIHISLNFHSHLDE